MPRGVIPQKVKCTGHASDGSGRPCKNWAMHGRTKCPKHGGKSPAGGVSHPAFKHGKYSQFVPRGIKTTYENGLRNPDLLSMNDELAVLDARAAQLLQRIETGESEERWKLVQEAMRTVLSFQAQGDDENVEEAISELAKLVFAGGDYDAWREIMAAYDTRRKISNTERARRVAAEQSISVAQLMAFVAAMSSIVVSHVTDPVARAAIAEDVRRLVTREGYSASDSLEMVTT